MKPKKSSLSWIYLYLITFLAAYLYIFNEWLFAVTKPSFVNGLAITQQLQIFLAISALLASLCFLALLPLVILSLLPPLRSYTDILIKLGVFLPAVIGAALILIMVDNFTYTVFKWGIVSTEGWNRILYGLGFIVVIGHSYRSMLNTLVRLNRHTMIWGIQSKWILSLLTGVLLLSLAALLLPDRTRVAPFSTITTTNIKRMPHILLITADGVNASHTSLYGYQRDTTPNLQKLAESAVVSENAFSNASQTGGSVVSIYTGKYPAKTRVFWIPNMLKGDDAYEHLPGILRSHGYRTVQITVPLFLDPAKLNLLNGFDEVKFNQAVHSKYLNQISRVLQREKALFTDEILKRLIDRVRHIFFITKMGNPYFLVTTMPAERVDMERWENLRHEIQTAKQPLFVHIHLMVTHGKTFNPVEQKFSAGQAVATQPDWSDDFYDDSILEVDKNVGELVDYLREMDLLDKTVLIIGSDHGQRHKQLKRVPLMFRFPNGEYAGRINANVQNLDMAPTLLDYIGIDQPDWMRGNSLIADDLAQRPIFGVSEIDPQEWSADNVTSVVQERPPAGFDIYILATVIYCTKWYSLNLYTMSWESGTVDGSTTACQSGREITDKLAFQWILEHLQENGFDVSNLSHLDIEKIKIHELNTR
jgi:hypothetical protein